MRKLHFLLRARALVFFPGGYGTLDELFEALTLLQTGRIKPLPVLLFGESFWRRIIDFDGLVEIGVISPEDLDLIRFVESAEEALAIIKAAA
jgi:predicted Rossmann-fold nucleotide-binding protein